MAVTGVRLSVGWREAAARPVNSASAAFFRIAFGVAMLVNVLLYLPYLVDEYYVATSFHFSYAWFTFAQPLPGAAMQVVYVVQGVLAVLVALGLWYRWAIAGFFVLHTYVFLIDSTFFQNHEYLISLVSFFMIFMPLNRRWALDARRRSVLASPTVPVWVVWLIRFQFGIVYFYGGVAKLNADWLQGEPLRMWLHARTDLRLIGPLFEHEPVVWFMTYGALVLDLTVVWFLLHRRTRVAAFVVATCFHLLNAYLFGLYVFPWLMIAATTIYFAPDWPERAWSFARNQMRSPGSSPVASSSVTRADQTGAWPARISQPLTVFLAVWTIVQVVLPLRHYLIPGSPNWTEEGHRFAWHMKLRDKQGTGAFYLTSDDRTWEVPASDYLSWEQEFRMYGHPERLARFAHHLSDEHNGAEVRVETWISLNGREPAPLVDPEVDLSSVPLVGWGNADWILPLEVPLRGD
ncbi:HTTM domain-containing protein [Phytoactinopolyspora alkaliphila]|uniref:HTTM domain-containing protein n=1 Tax=Phytoactinopolyspora alkaliphila TaxID=1783498 RepID=A0A6N9YMU5_9ACTN|nr:HTTM domain-containing protein [Phytoactinopolyspora alkaliphila]